MPHARFDVELCERFQEIPAKERPVCMALYWRAVLFSSQMLLDGEISGPILAALVTEVGVKPYTESHRTFTRVVDSLVSAGFFERHKDGGIRITEWEAHHSRRSDVQKRRNRDAELKREARAQLVLPNVLNDVRRGHPRGQGQLQPGMSAKDSARALRAQADRELQKHNPSAVSERTMSPVENGAYSTGKEDDQDDPEPRLR